MTITMYSVTIETCIVSISILIDCDEAQFKTAPTLFSANHSHARAPKSEQKPHLMDTRAIKTVTTSK